jgi:transposase
MNLSVYVTIRTLTERRIFTEDFKKEAVRLTETSGRTIGQVADDLGIGLSSLTRWKRQYREADLLAGPHEDAAKELARLRKENELLRQEREILKRAATFFAKEGSR